MPKRCEAAMTAHGDDVESTKTCNCSVFKAYRFGIKHHTYPKFCRVLPARRSVYLINAFCCANKHPRNRKIFTKHLCCSLSPALRIFFFTAVSVSVACRTLPGRKKEENVENNNKRSQHIHTKCENENFVVGAGLRGRFPLETAPNLKLNRKITVKIHRI